MYSRRRHNNNNPRSHGAIHTVVARDIFARDLGWELKVSAIYITDQPAVFNYTMQYDVEHTIRQNGHTGPVYKVRWNHEPCATLTFIDDELLLPSASEPADPMMFDVTSYI